MIVIIIIITFGCGFCLLFIFIHCLSYVLFSNAYIIINSIFNSYPRLFNNDNKTYSLIYVNFMCLCVCLIA